MMTTANATTIPTWNELPTARGTCEGVLTDEQNTFSLQWSFQVGDREIAQEVTARELTTFGEAWLLMTAVVGPASVSSRRSIARANQQLNVGRFGVKDGILVVSHAIPMELFGAVEIERLLGIVAFEAAQLRAAVEPTYCA
jgi:hypothetical protein